MTDGNFCRPDARREADDFTPLTLERRARRVLSGATMRLKWRRVALALASAGLSCAALDQRELDTAAGPLAPQANDDKQGAGDAGPTRPAVANSGGEKTPVIGIAPGAEPEPPPGGAGACGQSADRPADVCPGALEDDWHWQRISSEGAPEPRVDASVVWTGSEMIVWGGYRATGVINTGGRYHAATDTWRSLPLTNAPSPRSQAAAVWTGTEMLVFPSAPDQNATGGAYNPATDTWRAISTAQAPAARSLSQAVWTGSEALIWGGYAGAPLKTGGRYDPVADTWTAMSLAGAPDLQNGHVLHWTGTEMIAWGRDGSPTMAGASYNPISDSWRPISKLGALSARTATDGNSVWTGSQLIVWGGLDVGPLSDGASYDPVTDVWSPVSPIGTPEGRGGAHAVWSGTEMIFWGGRLANNFVATSGTGGRYDPELQRWAPITQEGSPGPRRDAVAVWADAFMIIWGGDSGEGPLDDGFIYAPPADDVTAAGGG